MGGIIIGVVLFFIIMYLFGERITEGFDGIIEKLKKC